MPRIEKAERREAARQRERYGQRGQAKWWHAVAQSQARRARLLEARATRHETQGAQDIQATQEPHHAKAEKA
jgi:hypothetical protein